MSCKCESIESRVQLTEMIPTKFNETNKKHYYLQLNRMANDENQMIWK